MRAGLFSFGSVVVTLMACSFVCAGVGGLAGGLFGTIMFPVAGTVVGFVLGACGGFLSGVLAPALGARRFGITCALGGVGAGLWMGLPITSWPDFIGWVYIVVPGVIGGAVGRVLDASLYGAPGREETRAWLSRRLNRPPMSNWPVWGKLGGAALILVSVGML